MGIQIKVIVNMTMHSFPYYKPLQFNEIKHVTLLTIKQNFIILACIFAFMLYNWFHIFKLVTRQELIVRILA